MPSHARATPGAKAAQAGSSSSWQSNQQNKANELTRLQNMASHVKVLDSPFFPKNTHEYLAHQSAMQDDAKAAMQHRIDQRIAAQGVKGAKIEPAFRGKSVPSLESVGGGGGEEVWRVGPHDLRARGKGVYASARGWGDGFGGEDGWPDKLDFKKFGDARVKLGFERLLPPPGKKFQEVVPGASAVVSRDGSPSKGILNLRSRGGSLSKVKGAEAAWNQYAAQSGFPPDMERGRQHGAQGADWNKHAAYEAAWKAWAYGSENVPSGTHDGLAGIWNDYGAQTGPWNEHGATFGGWPDAESGYGQQDVAHGALGPALSQTGGYGGASDTPSALNKFSAHDHGHNRFRASQFRAQDFANNQFGFTVSYDPRASQFASRQTESHGNGSNKSAPENAFEKAMHRQIRVMQEKVSAQDAAYAAMMSSLRIQGDNLKGITRKSDHGTPCSVLKACAKEFEYGLGGKDKDIDCVLHSSVSKDKNKGVESDMMRILERKLHLPRLDTASTGSRWPKNPSDGPKVHAWKAQQREREQQEEIGSWLDASRIKIPTAEEIAEPARKEQEEYVPEGGWTFDERTLRTKGEWAPLLDAIDK